MPPEHSSEPRTAKDPSWRFEGGAVPGPGQGAWLLDVDDVLGLSTDPGTARAAAPADRAVLLTVVREGTTVSCRRLVIDRDRAARPGFGPGRAGKGSPVHIEAILPTLAFAIGGPRSPEAAAARAWLWEPFASMGAVLATLDAEGIEAWRGYEALGPGLLAGFDASMTPGAPLRRAFEARPAYVRLLARAWRADPGGLASAVAADALDPFLFARGRAEWKFGKADAPVIEAIHEHVRALDGKSAGRVAEATGADRDQGPEGGLCSIAALVPQGWRPRTPAEAAAFARQAGVVAMSARVCATGDVAGFLAASGRWAEFHGRLDRAAGRRLTDEGRVAFLYDAATAYGTQVLVPAIAAARGGGDVSAECLEGVAWTMLHSGMTLPSALRLSARWHDRRSVIDAVLAANSSLAKVEAEWPSVLPEWSEGDLSVVQVATGRALIHEGSHGRDPEGVEGLAHCVSSYVDACRAGRKRILGVRRTGPDGRVIRVATVEVAFESGLPEVRQHVGKGNAPPPAESEALVGRYVGLLRSGDLPIDLAGLRPLRAIRSPRRDADERAFAFELAMAQWRPLLPRGLRAASAEGLFEAVVAMTGGRGAERGGVRGLDPAWLPTPCVAGPSAPPRGSLPRHWTTFPDLTERRWRTIHRSLRSQVARRRIEQMRGVMGHVVAVMDSIRVGR